MNEQSELLPRVSGWSEKKGVKLNYFKQDFGSKTEPLIFNGKCKIPLQNKMLSHSIVSFDRCNLKVLTEKWLFGGVSPPMRLKNG